MRERERQRQRPRERGTDRQTNKHTVRQREENSLILTGDIKDIGVVVKVKTVVGGGVDSVTAVDVVESEVGLILQDEERVDSQPQAGQQQQDASTPHAVLSCEGNGLKDPIYYQLLSSATRQELPYDFIGPLHRVSVGTGLIVQLSLMVDRGLKGPNQLSDTVV